MAGMAGKAVDISGAMVTGPVDPADWLVIAPVVIPVVFGALLLMFRKETREHAAVAIIGLLLLVAADAALLAHVLARGHVVMTMGRWLPPFGISFTADALGATLALTAGVVALVAGFYSIRDIGNTGRRYGFYPFFLLMMAGVSGSFLTGDIFNLYVWFEVLLISSFGLLILGSEHEQIDGATKYAFLNLVATTLFLIATGYLYGIFGTLNMADIARKASAVGPTAPIMTLAMLYFFAFAMKAAAFPVNFWLPASYHTPRVVVSALFAGLLTKVGIYALLRTQVMLFPAQRDIIAELIAWVAAATMILGALGALAQSDIRRMMGFIVVSGIGVMLAGLALASQLGLSATIFYAVHSMLVMTALYILAGLMSERAGSHVLHDMGGLYRAYPFMTAIALVLFLAVAGLPPFSGLWPKVFVVKAALDVGAWWLAFSVLLSGILTTIALARVFALAFWRDGATAAVEDLKPLRLGYVVLVALVVPVVWIGVDPEPLLSLSGKAAADLLDPARYIGAVFPEGGGS